ncbi:PREDICTED: uncharacterized protein LOC105137724 [Populus euphratica]|uniref:Uncharacterized protein LOC105137724 n=1 Tax=Populus euphratica TaxID=75702 RepID=A0AAJ6Y457_POPEU|nr:PREDICTED: uncharacterized protein LOC105137724 [Populus euphratica]XP_011041859.1 PREDICTED: uncharacterized protein LOC105137724 [Populus euphratica]
MGMMETSPITIAPLLIRNIATAIFIFADKSLVALAQKHKLLEHIRYLLVTSFLFFLRLLPSLFPSLNPSSDHQDHDNIQYHHLQPLKSADYLPSSGYGDSGIARALTQLLSIVNDIPVSSRKYEIVRSLAEKVVDDNHGENNEALREVNRGVLSAAFSRTLSQLEAAMMEIAHDGSENGGSRTGPVKGRLNQILKAVRVVGDGSWARSGRGREGADRSEEKLAAELLWLGQKLSACGCGEEAVRRWASASNLARLALSAEARLQGSLVKVSAFLFKQARELGLDEAGEGQRECTQRQTKMKMLMSWLPLLCRASNGTDAPVLSMRERAELEIVLEEMIDMLEHEEEQEQVLSLWLHHFTYTPSSDWPNLRASYARWCTASRQLLLLN